MGQQDVGEGGGEMLERHGDRQLRQRLAPIRPRHMGVDQGHGPGDVIARGFDLGVEGHMLAGMSAFLHDEIADRAAQGGRGLLFEATDRADEEALPVGKGQAEGVHHGRTGRIAAHPQARGRRRPIDTKIARPDAQISRCALYRHPETFRSTTLQN